MAARSKSCDLLNLSKKFGASYACLEDPSAETTQIFRDNGIKLMAGTEGLEAISTLPEVDHVVFASSGTGAITALQCALKADKDVSLANKESIVAAGFWIMPLARRSDQIRPLDSEHSAIWQCLRDEPSHIPSKITLTASGGPFRDFSIEQMKHITPEDALRHPVWNMGAKITVDSSNLMNKGIECIEAMRLFGVQSDRVGAVIHPSSQIHGIVEFCDATMKLLCYRPDMRIPAACALAWPDRLPLEASEEFTLPGCDEWSFEFSVPDTARFPCFRIALDAAKSGGAYPPLLIGADEAAVRAFLDKRIPFLDISNIIENVLENYAGPAPSNLIDAMELISVGERIAEEICSKRR
jgi:1-deoxy-D-xylulose-5-phosphate reductoisomerase